jgi:hypothetical protein
MLIGDPITISNAGYFVSPTLIPLDQLTTANYPPTGSTDSPFTSLSGLDGAVNASGVIPYDQLESVTVPAAETPLPATALTGLAGLVAVAGFRPLKGRRFAGASF